jgi:hypothetical protein
MAVNDINKEKTILMTIDDAVLSRYEQYYFLIHKKAKRKPISHPYHESINTWMIMKRPKMNTLKQRWKDFIRWFVDEQGYTNLRIERCEVHQIIYYPTDRRHDTDNSTPKFILDGLVESNMVIDDDSKHIVKLILECRVDKEHPRTELYLHILTDEQKEDLPNG